MKYLQDQLDEIEWPTQGLTRAEVHTFPINERHHQKKILKMTKPRQVPDHARIHVGVAGFFNFDMAAKAKSDAIVLCDINQDQIIFWRSIIKLLAQSPDRNSFRKAFAERVDYARYHHGLGETQASRAVVDLRWYDISKQHPNPDDFLRGQHWLRSPKAYQHLHRLAQEGMIATAPLDILDEAQCSVFGERIAALDFGGRKPLVDTIYGANVYDLMQDHPHPLLSLAFSHFSRMLTAYGKTMGTALIKGSNHADVCRMREELCEVMSEWLLDSVSGPPGMKKEMPEAFKHKVEACSGAIVDSFLHALRSPENIKNLNVYIELNKNPTNKKLKEFSSALMQLDQALFNELVQHPELDEAFLKQLGMIGEDIGQVYSGKYERPEYVSYGTLRNLANSPDTKIYCTSVRERPLVIFEGPDSPNRTLRDLSRRTGVQLMTLKPGDTLIGRP